MVELVKISPLREIAIAPDEEAAVHFAATQFIDCACAAIAKHKRFSVALSGGSTPKKLYETLLKPEFAEQIDWARVDLFWSDERCVAPDSPESNYGMAMHYFNQAPLNKTAKFRMPADSANLNQAAQEYEMQIRKYCFEHKFDLVLLGIGDDGHTASLFPHTAALQEEKHLVVAAFVPEKKSYRMTLTFPCINQARKIMVLALGKAKAEVLKTIFYGPQDFTKYPAQKIGLGAAPALFIIDSNILPSPMM